MCHVEGRGRRGEEPLVLEERVGCRINTYSYIRFCSDPEEDFVFTFGIKYMDLSSLLFSNLTAAAIRRGNLSWRVFK